MARFQLMLAIVMSGNLLLGCATAGSSKGDEGVGEGPGGAGGAEAGAGGEASGGMAQAGGTAQAGGATQPSAGQAGSPQGGSSQGGKAQAGSSQGGMAQAGASQGGSSQGGMAQGGSSQGGMAQAGSSQGGMAQAGSSQGGMAQGGAPLDQAAVDACVAYQDYSLGDAACDACKTQHCAAEFAQLEQNCGADADVCNGECGSSLGCFCECTTTMPGGCGQIEASAYKCMVGACAAACGGGAGGAGGGAGGAGGSGGAATEPKAACLAYQDYLLDASSCVACRDDKCKAIFDKLFADCAGDADTCSGQCGGDLDCFCGCTTTLAGGCGDIESQAYVCMVDGCSADCQ